MCVWYEYKIQSRERWKKSHITIQQMLAERTANELRSTIRVGDGSRLAADSFNKNTEKKTHNHNNNWENKNGRYTFLAHFK